MSKSTSDLAGFDDAPPSYDSIDNTAPPSKALPRHEEDDDEAPSTMRDLLLRLSQLPAHIQRSRQDHASAQAFRDASVVSLLVPHVSELITDMENGQSPMTLGEAVLVPAAAVPANWKLSSKVGEAGDSFTSIQRIIHVEAPRKKADTSFDQLSEKERQRRHYEAVDAGGSSSSSNPHRGRSERMEEESRGPHSEFDEWGRWGGATVGAPLSPADRWNTGEWWWSDEDSALRISRHIQPPAPFVEPPPASPLQEITRAVTQGSAESKRRSFLGRLFGSDNCKKGKSRDQCSSSTPVSPVVVGKQRFGAVVPGVVMTVDPVQLTFRQENEMGIWESRSGWGLLVQVKVNS